MGLFVGLLCQLGPSSDIRMADVVQWFLSSMALALTGGGNTDVDLDRAATGPNNTVSTALDDWNAGQVLGYGSVNVLQGPVSMLHSFVLLIEWTFVILDIQFRNASMTWRM